MSPEPTATNTAVPDKVAERKYYGPRPTQPAKPWVVDSNITLTLIHY